MALLGPRPAAADRLTAETFGDSEVGYTAVEELSYETIIEASSAFGSEMRIRVALHNSSSVTRDAVHALALPRGGELRSVAIARDGVWTEGKATHRAANGARRDPGTVFARPLEPQYVGELPGAEVVAFGLEPGVTIQVELRVRIYPQLRGDRWQMELPDRGKERVALAPTRRVLVKGLAKGAEFWADGAGSADNPAMLTSPAHAVLVEWPARRRSSRALNARYEALPNPNRRGGKFRLYLRLGESTPPNPDHVLLLVDRSRSTSPRMQRDTLHLAETLFDSLPDTATFDVVGFARHANALSPSTRSSVKDLDARRGLAQNLDQNVRDQGTDLRAALELTGERLAKRRAKRPLVLVVTDGMLAGGLDLDGIRTAFTQKLGGTTHPDVLFVVDDPVLLGAGVAPEHPIARMAAALGARVSLEPLAHGRFHRSAASSQDLLRAPRVLGDLGIKLPRGTTVETELPSGLVAGALLVVEGTYTGRSPGKIQVSGRFGARKVRQTVKPRTEPSLPQAMVAVADGVADLKTAIGEGYTLPAWYSSHDRHLAQLEITRAGRTGVELRGQLDRQIVRSYLRMRVLPRAQVCYKHAVARDQTQGGRVLLDIQIGKGEVILAQVAKTELTKPDDKLIACLHEAAWSLDIPAAKLDGRVYRIRYPLSLTPPANGVAPSVDDPLGKGSLELILDTFPGSGE